MRDVITSYSIHYTKLYDLLLSTEFQFVSVKQYLDKLIENIFSLFSSDADISIEKSLSDFDITSKQAFLIGLIVNSYNFV